MSNGPIPLHVEPRKLVDRGISFSGELPLSKFKRLDGLLTNTAGAVRVNVAFERDVQKHPLIKLELNTDVPMICQRCLEEVAIPVGGRYDYVVVREGANTDELPSSYEIVELGDEPLDLLALIEDELLLCLPVVPMHPQDVCRHPSGFVETELEESARPSPFSVLAQLKPDAKP